MNKTNLTKRQENALHYFIMNDEHIILLTDKNLGPCVMSRTEHIKQCTMQNLPDASTYERISKEAAFKHIETRQRIPGLHQTTRPGNRRRILQTSPISS